MLTLPVSPVTNVIATTHTSTNSHSNLLAQIQSGQHFIIAPNCGGGLLIVKPFYVDFAGAGAAVGGEFDRHCTAVYAIGEVRLQQPNTRDAREESLYTRIAYAERLTTIINISVPLRRGCLILEQLGQWLSSEIADRIPAELIGKLVSINPVIAQLARQSRKELADDMPTLVNLATSNVASQTNPEKDL